jgi:hypothetical protein
MMTMNIIKLKLNKNKSVEREHERFTHLIINVSVDKIRNRVYKLTS